MDQRSRQEHDADRSERMFARFMALLESATYERPPTGLRDLPPPEQEQLDFSTWRRRPVPPLCHGCPAFTCVSHWRGITDVPQGRDAEDWMRNHDLFFPPICPSHGLHFMSDVPGKPNLSMCGHREPGKVNRCRLKVCKWSPFISPRTQLTPGQVLLVWADIANNMCTGQITRNRGLDRKVVQDLLHTLADAALRNETMSDYEFSRVQVDETFIGKRKYNRGRRQRKRGWWFATVTESRGTGKTGRTHWKLVKRRDTPTLHGFIIPHLASARSVVVSDCWGAYNGLDQVCRHYSVNHSKEFVNEKGYHTNGAESVHNTIKYWVRLQHYNFGATTLELQRNVALQCVKYGDTHNGREQSWQSRFVNIMKCIKDNYGFPVPEEFEELSSDSCASDYEG